MTTDLSSKTVAELRAFQSMWSVQHGGEVKDWRVQRLAAFDELARRLAEYMNTHPELDNRPKYIPLSARATPAFIHRDNRGNPI